MADSMVVLNPIFPNSTPGWKHIASMRITKLHLLCWTQYLKLSEDVV